MPSMPIILIFHNRNTLVKNPSSVMNVQQLSYTAAIWKNTSRLIPGKSLSIAIHARINAQERDIWLTTRRECMKQKNLFNAMLAHLNAQRRVIWPNTRRAYMKKKNLFNVMYAHIIAQIRDLWLYTRRFTQMISLTNAAFAHLNSLTNHVC